MCENSELVNNYLQTSYNSEYNSAFKDETELYSVKNVNLSLRLVNH